MVKSKNRIKQGGQLTTAGAKLPDVVLQMPEIFYFDINAYMQSIQSAKSIDYSRRTRLYDMYESALLMDLHLSGVIAKRLRGVTQFPIEFRRDGKPDDAINEQLSSPWFKQLRKDLLLSEFWGYTLVQFYKDNDGNIKYDLINRKHYDPVARKILKYQSDVEGISIDNFSGMLFVGRDRDLGILAELLPAVLYKRGDMADWARFCNIFGMPIRDYTYDAGDEEARRRLINDARKQGSNAAYIHPKDSELKLIEAGNKTGSAELYQRFAEYWDGKMSVRVLGNTLTTQAQSTGTQALGTIHKQEESEMNVDDRNFILDILNYDMRPIFAELGFNVDNGKFVYAEEKSVDTDKQIVIVEKLNAMGLPISDDYLYSTFGIEKPEDYEVIKIEKVKQKELLKKQLEMADKKDSNDEKKQEIEKPSNAIQTPFKDRLKSFFGLAPQSHGATDF